MTASNGPAALACSATCRIPARPDRSPVSTPAASGSAARVSSARLAFLACSTTACPWPASSRPAISPSPSLEPVMSTRATRLPSAPPRRLLPEGSTMSSSPESPHLDNHHRNTLRQIFEHPVSHNIEWHAVTSLLDAIGTVTVHGGKVTIAVGAERQIFDHPVGKDIDAQMVVDLRHMLTAAGYTPS